MKKLLILSLVLFVAVPARAQTHAANGMAELALRNAKICDNYDGLTATCTDTEVQAAWCAANNKPAGAMCVASDTRPDSEKIFSIARFAAEIDAQVTAATNARQVKRRRATVAAVEIAMLDSSARAAICTAAKTAPGLGAGVIALLNACN